MKKPNNSNLTGRLTEYYSARFLERYKQGVIINVKPITYKKPPFAEKLAWWWYKHNPKRLLHDYIHRDCHDYWED